MHQGREALDYQAQTKVGQGFRSSSGSGACRSTYGEACDTGYQSNAPARNEQRSTDKLATIPPTVTRCDCMQLQGAPLIKSNQKEWLHRDLLIRKPELTLTYI